MPARPLMIQGTASNAGKSALVTGLCRILSRRKLLTVPFKPQNMALNSAVTVDGGEIGRAQALQAQACGLKPLTDMNPILLKPSTACGAQVIVQGKVRENVMDAITYHQFKQELMPLVIESYDRLASKFDYILIEGAGSPAEINLRQGDIANMGFAQLISCPVILIADIDRGGVFAHILGTLELLSEIERSLIKGFVINKFRGDINILKPGIDWLEGRTGKPVLGVVPYIDGLRLDAEDSLANNSNLSSGYKTGDHILPLDSIEIAVVRLPRLSNQTDFEPLSGHPQVRLRYINEAAHLRSADLIILPGSKSVREDLRWLKEGGFEPEILRHLRYGGKLLGICGGFQMLGAQISDPSAIESDAGVSVGLGLFNMETVLTAKKTLALVNGHLSFAAAPVSGYEIHMGVSSGAALANHAIDLGERVDGAISPDNKIMGTYLHGLFDGREALDALLAWAGLVCRQGLDYQKLRETNIDILADVLEEKLDLKQIFALLGYTGSEIILATNRHE